ncbi:MAG: SDR family NAD(P)-dependent oxidoreductase, partial [Pseudomonadota bacterium]
RSVTISGPVASIAEFAADAKGKRIALKRLDLDYPFHCALVDPIRDPLMASLKDLAPGKTRLPLVSTVTGEVVAGPELDGTYWWANVRQPVLFRPAVKTLLDQHKIFLEIGPRPVLTGYLSDAARSDDKRAAVLPSFKEGEDRSDPVEAIVRAALAHGARVDDSAVFGPKVASPRLLPAYPWQHCEYRKQMTSEQVRLLEAREHALLGDQLRDDDVSWRMVHDARRLPFLADHKVEDAVVFPAAGFVEMLLGAGRHLHPDAPLEIRDLDIYAPLVLDAQSQREVRTREIAPATFVIESRARLSGEPFMPHVKATLGKAPAAPEQALPATLPDDAEVVPAARLYEMTAAFGLPYGPIFRRASQVTLCGDDKAHVRLAAADPSTARYNFVLDPTLFDSCFHALFAFLDGRTVEENMSVLPVRLGRLVLKDGAGAPTAADIDIRRLGTGVLEADFVLFDAERTVIGRATGLRFQAVPLGRRAGGTTLYAAPYVARISRAAEPSTVAADWPTTLASSPAAQDAQDPDTAEPTETALLIEAGVQAAAAEVLGPWLSEPTAVASLVEAGRLDRSAIPLAMRLLLALEASGQAEEVDGNWCLTGEAIALDDVVALLVAEHPGRLAETALLAALPQVLSHALENGLGDELPFAEPLLHQLATDAPYAAPMHEALLAALKDFFAATGGVAVRVGVVGASHFGFIRQIASAIDPQRIRLTVTDREPAALERLALNVEAGPGVEFVPFDTVLTDRHPYDVVVVAPTIESPRLDGLLKFLKPGGRLVGAAYGPTLFADAIFGLAADWWGGSVDPSAPVGRLMSIGEWENALADAGLHAGAVTSLSSGDTDAIVWSGLAPLDDEAPAPLELPSLHAVGEAARRMCVALSAMAETPPPIHDLSTIPEGAVLIAVDETDPSRLAEDLDALGTFFSALGQEARTVTMVTLGAQVSGANEVQPAAAAISAFGRVVANEFPNLALRLVDVAHSFEPSEAAVRLAAELAQPNAEREIVLASDHRGAMRYRAAPPATASGDMTTLAIAQRGSIDQLAYTPSTKPELAPHEVRLKVDATGLNFRDVMWTLGLLPHEALQDGFAGPTLGMECAGVIEAVGSKVYDLGVGDDVVAFAPACFASHVTVSAEAVTRRPAELGVEAAATVPVAFLTAYYALIELGQLEEDETVLIHGGAGGVGLAALQIAKWRGARVVMTAGSLEKRALLMRLGADAVFNSRGLTFADEALAFTGGEGVDVVLNSLAGEAMERSVAALKPFGRFLELGKRDFYADTKLGLRPFRRNLSYFGIDADQLMKHKPKKAKRILETVMDRFVDGDFNALPYRTFRPEGIHDAFRLMQSAGHIGKIVVKAPEAATPRPAATPVADPKKAYLLVGGTSGFGFATAEWLIGEGARHLILASRSGVKDEAIEAAIAQHRQNGVSISTPAVDVTDETAVRALVDQVAAERALGGVFHMAMVLDDALISSLDADRYRTALSPKVAGIVALEAATEAIPLDHFVVYSSITVQLGNPGQANYVAANAYLEAVARRRRAEGKPALAVAWGAIADVGVLARDMATSELLQKKLGKHAVTAGEALGGLKALIEEGAMTEGPAVRLVGKVDWSAARKDLVLAASPAFEDLATDAGQDADEGGTVDLAARLSGLSDQEAVAEVSRLLTQEISRILKMSPSDIDAHKPLTALGMDSLMGVELRMAAEQRLGIDIPLMSLAAGVTVADLSKKVVERVRGEAALVGEDAEAMASRHLGEDLEKTDYDVGALEAAVREKTANRRTILS